MRALLICPEFPFSFWSFRKSSRLRGNKTVNPPLGLITVAALLPTDRIRLSAWESADVSAEVYVVIEQFDVDARGQGALVAWWRILSPGGDKSLQSGECRLAREGPPPEPDPSGSIATLSGLMADFSRQLAQALQQTTSSAPNAPTKR